MFSQLFCTDGFHNKKKLFGRQLTLYLSYFMIHLHMYYEIYPYWHKANHEVLCDLQLIWIRLSYSCFYIDLPFCTNVVFLVDYIDLARSPTKRVQITYQLLLFQITWLLAKFLHHKQWTVSIGLCPCFGMIPTSVSIKCSIAVQLSWKWKKLKILFGKYRLQYLEA